MMNKPVFASLLLIFTLAFQSLVAQGTLRGTVIDKSSGEPIVYAAVELTGTAKKAATDYDGFFQLNDVPAGTIRIKISIFGYSTLEREVNIQNGKFTTETFYLESSTNELSKVEVTGQRVESETKVLTAVTSLSPRNIQRFSIGGEPDLIRAIQVLPGVITTGDQGGQLYIRGGSPIQNLTLLDGMALYNPFHSIGFFSVFDTDILRSADVYSAGFNAKYGGRNSSVMDVRTRPGNRQRVAGKVGASTYMGKALLEIPIGKKDQHGFAPTSLLVSYKRSFLSESSPVFYPYIETEYGGLPFEFEDIYSKFSYQSSGGSELNLFGFNFSDRVRFAGDKSLKWNSFGYGADFKLIPSSSATIINGNFALSEYLIESDELIDRPRSSKINGFNSGLNFTYFAREHDELNYGFEVSGYFTSFRLVNAAGRTVSEEQNTTEMAGYFQYKMVTGRFLFEPGLRLHYYSSLAEFRIEPRIGLKYNANEWMRFKAAAGMYSQNLVAINSDRDVVNLFYGIIATPEKTPASEQPLDGKLQTADHYVVGVELDFGDYTTIEVETYMKDFNLITNTNRNKIYDDNQSYVDQPDHLKRDFLGESGLAYGVDFLVKYNRDRWNFWGTYSWSKVTRDDGQMIYAPHFDRRYNTNLVASYTLGKNRNWDINVRWNFGSGFPFTPIAGYYQSLPFTDENNNPEVDYPYPTENGELGTLYGEINSKRLPVYHRLDVTVKKRWKLGQHSFLDVSLAATNIYNRANIFYYDTNQRERVNQLPFMPTLIATYSF